MGFKDVFKKSFLEGFTSMDITTAKIVATLFVSALLALYVFAIYRLVTRKVFYSKNFNISAGSHVYYHRSHYSGHAVQPGDFPWYGRRSFYRAFPYRYQKIRWIWYLCSGLSVLELFAVQVSMK